MAIDTGGPAFPVQVIEDKDGILREVSAYGFISELTVRDYLATRAPSMPTQFWDDSHRQWPERHWAEIDAAWRYFHADAMMKERAK